ncbi:membrane protein required for colicin V production [Desulfobaculum xiamenense]|uniref:Membrane protein required for colicin V production n=1 Tax=Desulfobaculum xiamenense TaxID=995050 RepID=A0A846QM35_9BACT|nr:CvpA family protein [Desulfobaculum xiamenense]NJB68090.1 membrane protein required for colicin V production [Desulfobaculum xiamenense]
MFNFLDVVFIAIAAFFFIRGAFRGLIKEVASTLGLILAYWLANTRNDLLVDFYATWFKSPGLLHFLSYVSVFVGVMLAVSFCAWVLVRLFRIMPVLWVDIPGGAAVGMAKAGAFCCIILVALGAFMPEAEFVKQSRIAPYLHSGVEMLSQFTPEKMRHFDPSDLRERMRLEREEALDRFLSGGNSTGGDLGQKSMELLDKMKKSLNGTGE